MRKVVLTSTALRDIQALPADIRLAMIGLIDAFAAGREVGASILRNRSGDVVRLKQGEHRAIVSVARGAVTVRRVRHRSIVYRP